MKATLRKEDLQDFLVSWGWLVLLLIALSYVVWYWPITTLDQIKSTEKINFFAETYGYKENTLDEDLKTALKDDGVVEVNLYSYAPESGNLDKAYDAYGASSDFLVLPEDDMAVLFQDTAKTSVLAKFVPYSSALKSEVLQGISDDYSYYSVNEQAYGLKIYDPADASYNLAHPFSRLLEFSSGDPAFDAKHGAYYLLLNAQTVNWGVYGGTGESAHAVDALRYLVETYRGA
jgi:hypothetical protein